MSIYNNNIKIIKCSIPEVSISTKYEWTIKINKKNITNTKIYSLDDISLIQKYYEKNNDCFTIYTPKYDKTPYKYIMKLNYLGKNIDILNNVMSIPFQKINQVSIQNWIQHKLKNNNILIPFKIRLNQPAITINTNIINQDIIDNDKRKYIVNKLLNYPWIKNEETNIKSPALSDEYKIHMMVDIKYLFWTIETIIKNSEKFIIEINNEKKPIFSCFKIHTDFFNFTLRDGFLFPKKNENIIIIDEEHYKLKNDNKVYKFEKMYNPNITFYQYADSSKDITKKCFQKLVKVLLELFPDSLNISSNNYSKFTFKINNNLFLCIGNGDKKKQESIEYTIPIEYKDIIDKCRSYSHNQCNKANALSMKLSNIELLKFDNNKCVLNNIRSYNFLVKNEVLKNSIKYIYDYCGIEFTSFQI